MFSNGHKTNVRTGQNAQIYLDIDRTILDVINYSRKKEVERKKNVVNMRMQIKYREHAMNNPEEK